MADRGGGLEGVVVARSSLCSIDGARGVLRYRGYDVRELAAAADFEEVSYLLICGELPTREAHAAWSERLRGAREEHSAETRSVVDMLARGQATPMEMLRTAVSSDSFDDALKASNATEANVAKAVGLLGRMPLMVARYARIRRGLEPIEADPELGQAANFLWMLHGERPSPAAHSTFDAALILHADHEMNASTFTARVIASTLADMHSAITGAIGALKGPLHGGANEQVMRLLEEIGEPERAEDVVRAKLAAHERIMGFGHRVYRTWDPRALVLQELARPLAAEGDPRWLAIADRVEAVVSAETGLYPNVDFASAPTYRYLGIPTDVFTAIFAISRVAGWSAHVIEQHADNRLIRPSSEYVGPAPRPYVPIAER